MAEPISTAEAKKHLRVESSVDDTLIADKIIAAREWVEDYTGLVLTQREITETLPRFSSTSKLRAWPVAQDQPATLTYRDASGVEQTISDAQIVARARPAVIYPTPGSRWPSDVAGEIAVTFTAGYIDAASVPQKLKQAVLIMLTAFYEDRDGGDLFAASEKTAMRLCRREKRRTL
jgi:uncharacterized phiE125 gp8 family phage protein